MSDPESRVYEPEPIPGLEHSKGCLSALVLEQRWLEKRLKSITEQIAHCRTHIKILEEHPHLADKEEICR